MLDFVFLSVFSVFFGNNFFLFQFHPRGQRSRVRCSPSRPTRSTSWPARCGAPTLRPPSSGSWGPPPSTDTRPSKPSTRATKTGATSLSPTSSLSQGINHNIHLKTESTELYYTILTVCRPSHHHSSIICRGSNEEMQSASSKYVEDHHRMEIFCKCH